MGTTLTGTTPQDTYDSLIKVTDNGPLSGTAKYLSDGLGNDSALALSTGNIGIGTTSPSTYADGAIGLSILQPTTGRSVLSLVGTQSSADEILGRLLFTNTSTTNTAKRLVMIDGVRGADDNSGYLTIQTSNAGTTSEKMRITSTGNVGIGTSTLGGKFQVKIATDANIAFNEVGGVSRISCFNDAIDAAQPLIISGETIRFTPAGTEVGRFTTNGLTFNGDTAAANALDDYEEGTWTMGIAFNGASVGLTYSTQAGTYTKIGRQVTLNGRISLSAKGSSTGEARITGLPFTIANTEGNRSVPALRFANITFANQFQGFGVNNTTQILLQEITEAGTDSVLTDADFANNSEIFICFTYFV